MAQQKEVAAELDGYINDDNDIIARLKGKDGIKLDAPKVLLSDDTPLLTTAQDVAGAINELFQLDPGGGDWVPPDDWPEVPEPSEYGANFLIRIDSTSSGQNSFYIMFSQPETGAGSADWTLSIDWGDGNTETVTGGGSTHYYTDVGWYVVKVLTTENTSFYQTSSSNRTYIAKLGSSIVMTAANTNLTQNGFSNHGKIRWVKCSGAYPKSGFRICLCLSRLEFSNDLVTAIGNSYFDGCRLLTKIDLPNCVSIGNYGVGYCYSLREINIPQCTTIGNSAFNSCFNLKKMNIPLCTSIGDYAFQNGYSLEEFTADDGCTYGTSCFDLCDSLWPKPI
jgi:hypothetical protein